MNKTNEQVLQELGEALREAQKRDLLFKNVNMTIHSTVNLDRIVEVVRLLIVVSILSLVASLIAISLAALRWKIWKYLAKKHLKK